MRIAHPARLRHVSLLGSSRVRRLRRTARGALRARGHEVDEAVLRSGRRGRIVTPVAYAGTARPDALGGAAGAARRRLRPLPRAARPDRRRRQAGRSSSPPTAATCEMPGRAARSASSRAIVVRRARAVICVSEYVRERLGAPAEVIDCGVDIDRYRPTPRAPGDRGPRFLFVGSLTDRKNVGRLMRAFARLREGSLTIIGAGPLEAELRAAAPAGVRFSGRRTPEGVLLALREHDVVCLPSLEEPQGQAMLEALACGRPVVATRIGGPPEIMTPACGALGRSLRRGGDRGGHARRCRAARAVCRRRQRRRGARALASGRADRGRAGSCGRYRSP